MGLNDHESARPPVQVNLDLRWMLQTQPTAPGPFHGLEQSAREESCTEKNYNRTGNKPTNQVSSAASASVVLRPAFLESSEDFKENTNV